MRTNLPGTSFRVRTNLTSGPFMTDIAWPSSSSREGRLPRFLIWAASISEGTPRVTSTPFSTWNLPFSPS